jgi:hypothetical protein
MEMRRNHETKMTARVHLGIVKDDDEDMVDGLSFGGAII